MELNEIAAEVMKDVSVRAIDVFRDAIRRNKFVLSDDLYESFTRAMALHSKGAVAEISFLIYGRFKDMKSMDYSRFPPPIAPIKYFVEKVGVENFAYVPGYSDRSRVPTETQVNQIAYAIRHHMGSVPTVRRSVKKGWYNDEIGGILKEASIELRKKASAWVQDRVKENLENKV